MQIQLKLALKNPKILLVRVEVRPRLTRAWSDWLRYSWHFHPFCVFLSVLSQGCSSSRSPLIGSVTQSCLTLCSPMDCSTPGLPVHHQLPEPTQTHVHSVSDAIQPSHSRSSPFPPVFNFSQHQGLFQWTGSSHQVAKVLEFQLKHQSFHWTLRTDL